MATVSKTRAYHGTLTANTVDTVNLAHPGTYVYVLNRGSSDISVRLDGTAPTFKGDESFIVPAGTARRFDTKVYQIAAVKLISDTTGTPAYSVESIG